MPNADQIAQAFADQFGLTREPVTYVYETGLAYCSREPCRSLAMTATAGQPANLCYRPEQQALAVETAPGATIGYLYAADAAWLTILYAYDRRNLGADHGVNFAPEIIDHSQISSVLTGPLPDRPETRRLRYPKLRIRICLQLRYAWPLFVILSVLHLKDETEAPCVDIRDNPWLLPYVRLRQDYRERQYDQYSLPALLAATWIDLTAAGPASIMAATQ